MKTLMLLTDPPHSNDTSGGSEGPSSSTSSTDSNLSGSTNPETTDIGHDNDPDPDEREK